MALTYESLKDIYDGRKKGAWDRPMVGYRNCRVREDSNGNMVVKMHATDVAVFHPDGTIDFDCGNWYDSMTTRTRLWNLVGVSIYRDRNKRNYDQATRMSYAGETYPYAPATIRNGYIDPTGLRDEITHVNRSKAAKVASSMRKVRAAATVMLRLNALPIIGDHRGYTQHDAFSAARQAIAGDDMDYALRMVLVHYLTRWARPVYPAVFVKEAFKMFREECYKEDSAYEREVIEYGPIPLKMAA